MSKQKTMDWTSPPPAGFRRNSHGDFVHERNIHDIDRDMDATARKIHHYGQALSEQMWRFRDYTLTDVYEFVDRVKNQYGGKVGGRVGNVQIMSFDGRLKVQLAQAEQIVAGPEISAAQAIIEECIEEWSVRGNLKLRAIVDNAFLPDATGQVSVSQLLRLRRVEIDDPRWRQAQNAISDALRPAGKSEYIRLYARETPDDPWEPVPLHLAQVRRPDVDIEPAAEVLQRRLTAAIGHARQAGMSAADIRASIQAAKAKK